MRGVLGPDGSRLASTGDAGTVRLWDPRTGEGLLGLRGHIAAVGSVAFSPEGSQLVLAGGKGMARVWALDLDDLIEVAELELTRTFTDASAGSTCTCQPARSPDSRVVTRRPQSCAARVALARGQLDFRRWRHLKPLPQDCHGAGTRQPLPGPTLLVSHNAAPGSRHGGSDHGNHDPHPAR
jgi:WD domain, G-beta repeat